MLVIRVSLKIRVRHCAIRALLAGTLCAGRVMALAEGVAPMSPPFVQGNVARSGGQAVATDAAGNQFIIGFFSGTTDFNPVVGIDGKTASSTGR